MDLSALERIRNNIPLRPSDAVVLFDAAQIMASIGLYAGSGNICAIIGGDKVTLITAEGGFTPVDTDCGELEYHSYTVHGYEHPVNAIRNFITTCRNELLNLSRAYIDVYRSPFWLNEIFDTKSIYNATETLSHLFVTKPQQFIDGLIQTEQLNTDAFDAINRNIRPGISELELLDAVTAAYSHRYGGVAPMSYDLLGGARAAGISGGPSEYVLLEGDCLIADLSVNAGGYCIDTTRTFFAGGASEEQRMAYTAVIDALRRGEGMLTPGVTASDVFEAVSGSLTQAGYQALPHHAGHGVGYTWYEPPYFIPKCGDRLEKGMIVTLEPGVYVEGSFGIRIENNYRITDNGCENIFNYPESIDAFIR